MAELNQAERALAQRLSDEVDAFNLRAAGRLGFAEFVLSETDADGELAGGAAGWVWGGTCWLESLWVREDMRHHGLGSRLLAAVEAEAHRRECAQVALETHTFQAPDFYAAHGFEEVGRLPGYPAGHAQLMMRKLLV
jgi:N-acetylglutamate synthase-like GNAT family acetyltransferase